MRQFLTLLAIELDARPVAGMVVTRLMAHLQTRGLAGYLLIDQHVLAAMPHRMGNFDIHPGGATLLQQTVHPFQSRARRVLAILQHPEHEPLSLRSCPLDKAALAKLVV